MRSITAWRWAAQALAARDPVLESKGIHCCGLEPGAFDRTNRCRVEHNGCQAQPGRFDHNRIGTDVRRELGPGASWNASIMVASSSGECLAGAGNELACLH